MSSKIEVAIVDDHTMVIEGLKALLANYDTVTVGHTFMKGLDAYAHLSKNNTDIVLVDINLPDISGIELCGKLVSMHPEIKIIGISTHNDASMIRQMVHSGAKGYLIKNASADELYAAVERVY